MPDSLEEESRRKSPQSALAATSGNEYLSPLSQSPINNNYLNGFPLRTSGRLLLFLWSLFLCAGFALAASLQPDSRGFGTHQSLGFPACTFRILFEIPCPSCGMTTSFAHFTRAEFTQAARANIAGLLLAMTCLIQIPWCWLSVFKGRLWNVSDPVKSFLVLVGGLSTVALINWCWQLG